MWVFIVENVDIMIGVTCNHYCFNPAGPNESFIINKYYKGKKDWNNNTNFFKNFYCCCKEGFAQFFSSICPKTHLSAFEGKSHVGIKQKFVGFLQVYTPLPIISVKALEPNDF